MIINNVLFNVELEDILSELRDQLEINHIQYLNKFRNGETDIQVQCPYHGNGQERKPSAGIRKSDGQFHCFACNEVHSLPEVISFCFGHTDDILGKFGWSWLLKNFAIMEQEERKDVELDLSRNIYNRNNKLHNDSVYVNEQELDRYRYYHPYWKKRGIVNEDIIELFDLGYDKDTDCITMPVRDINGNCLFVARRSVKTKFFSYPKGVEKPLYGLYELSRYWKGEYNIEVSDEYGALHDIREYARPYVNEIIVCESMIDALTCWQYGKYAVALNGLGTQLQFKQLRELPCRKLILATDNDDAGIKARSRIRNNIKNKLITEYRIPDGKKDINELSLQEFSELEENF